jgi:hypothetical protein
MDIIKKRYKRQLIGGQITATAQTAFSQVSQGLNRKERKTTRLCIYMPLPLPFCAPCVVFVFVVIFLCAPCEKAVSRRFR